MLEIVPVLAGPHLLFRGQVKRVELAARGRSAQHDCVSLRCGILKSAMWHFGSSSSSIVQGFVVLALCA